MAIEAPELPAGSLKGPVYLAEQKSREPQSGQEYRIFFNAESSRYGVQVREEGKVKANPTTGQLTAEFTELPQVAFSSATLTFGPTAKHAIPVLSSPPLCTNTATSSAVPYSTGAVTADRADRTETDHRSRRRRLREDDGRTAVHAQLPRQPEHLQSRSPTRPTS